MLSIVYTKLSGVKPPRGNISNENVEIPTQQQRRGTTSELAALGHENVPGASPPIPTPRARLRVYGQECFFVPHVPPCPRFAPRGSDELLTISTSIFRAPMPFHAPDRRFRLLATQLVVS